MANTSNRFRPYVTEPECVPGPPFPRTLPYETPPPVFRSIANNRITPSYYLGWSIEHAELLARLDPDSRWSGLAMAFSKSSIPTEWKQQCAEKWPTTRPGFFIWGLKYVLLYVTDNDKKCNIEKSMDEELMETVKKIMGMNSDPIWFLIPDV
ncbi:hypothetical protein OH76DRAFT_8724 [Lentinus brumalis]|uniref:Uncharacterized protein n=1 Tax=Lentinus brumalis TaxID=2498619 RepID=A0A371DWY0_9APHY|nr:hypothetical protein OH76DRAFT_8724 [Polyporus brumalis]